MNTNVFNDVRCFIDSKGMYNDQAIFTAVFLYKSYQNADIVLLTPGASIAAKWRDLCGG